MSTEPETGTELQRRGETLPDVTVAHRAGSIVSEFVSSIVDEAASRGSDIIAEAHEEARALRRDASEQEDNKIRGTVWVDDVALTPIPTAKIGDKK